MKKSHISAGLYFNIHHFCIYKIEVPLLPAKVKEVKVICKNVTLHILRFLMMQIYSM